VWIVFDGIAAGETTRIIFSRRRFINYHHDSYFPIEFSEFLGEGRRNVVENITQTRYGQQVRNGNIDCSSTRVGFLKILRSTSVKLPYASTVFIDRPRRQTFYPVRRNNEQSACKNDLYASPVDEYVAGTRINTSRTNAQISSGGAGKEIHYSRRDVTLVSSLFRVFDSCAPLVLSSRVTRLQVFSNDLYPTGRGFLLYVNSSPYVRTYIIIIIIITICMGVYVSATSRSYLFHVRVYRRRRRIRHTHAHATTYVCV